MFELLTMSFFKFMFIGIGLSLGVFAGLTIGLLIFNQIFSKIVLGLMAKKAERTARDIEKITKIVSDNEKAIASEMSKINFKDLPRA